MRILSTKSTSSEIAWHIAGNAGLSLFLMTFLTRGAFTNLHSFLIAFVWFFSISMTQWGGLAVLYIIIDSKISWIKTPVKKVFVQIFAFLTYSTGAYILVQLVNYFIWRGLPPAQSWPWIIASIPYTVAISFIISLIFTTFGFFFAWKNSVVQAEKLKAEMMTYKYESLRNQINPHFLFNSLNVLSDLVYDDQALAVKFIRQMSDLFRYVLDSRDKELVTLKEELEFIRAYQFLLQTRFEDKLKIEIDVPINPDEYIVPMTLQLLIENAVKHNVVSDINPLTISIVKQDGFLVISNKLQPKNVGDESKKTGLRNIIQQYSFFSDQPIEINATEENFVVRIPLLTMTEK